ncbi:MAG: potassium channel family protein [Steroidobacteraceae bacterium]
MQAHIRMVFRHPSAALLFLQLASLFIYPLLIENDTRRALLTVVGTLAVLLAVWIVNRSPAMNWISWLLAVPAIGLTLAANQFGYVALTPWAHISESLLYFYTAYALITYMFSDQHVSTDELFAVGATFTLLAWAFSYACLFCQYQWPGSFTAAINSNDPRNWIEMLYFSFSVLSGTGLSDIVPITPPARALVMLEMFMGVMYIALVVSRLVGLSANKSKEH